MKVRTDGFTHFKQVEIAGDEFTSGNGIKLTPGASGSASTIAAVGDDTNVGLTLSPKGTGTVSLGNGTGNLTLGTSGSRQIILNSAAKTIVDGAATALFEVALTAGNMAGGLVHFLVRASDGTDHQAIMGSMTYAAVNKAGTITADETYATANEAKAVSSGTLTLAFTVTDDTNKFTVKVQPTGSLTETTPYTIEYIVYAIRGVVTIL